MKSIKLFFSLMVVLIIQTSYAQSYYGFSKSCPQSDTENLFLKAVQNRDTSKIKQYLSIGVNINGSYCEGFSSKNTNQRLGEAEYLTFQRKVPYIVIALQNRDDMFIRFFIENGANINNYYTIPKMKTEWSPYYRRNEETLVGANETSPLFNYILNSRNRKKEINKETLSYLFAKGARLTSYDIEQVKSHNDLQLCKLLSEYGNYHFTFDVNNLYDAIVKRKTEDINYYLSQGIKPDGGCLIASYTDAKDIELTKKILDLGVSIESKSGGSTLLAYAVSKKDYNFVKYLIERGADVNTTVEWNQQGTTFSYSQEQGLGRQYSKQSASLIDFAKAAKVGDDILEYLILAQAKVSQEKEKQAQLMQKAEQGDPEALYQLALLYSGGEQFPKEPAPIQLSGYTQNTPPHAASTLTWKIGEQTWSSAIHMPKCNKKSSFAESDTKPNCRSYTKDGKTYYYYNWPYVNKNADKLCPAPWRVPTQTDLNNLVNNTGTEASILRPYLIAAWGFSGLAHQQSVLSVSDRAFYWTAAENNGIDAFYLSYGSDGPNSYKGNDNKGTGLQLRCVK